MPIEKIKQLMPEVSIRLRVGIALAVAVLPFMIVLLLAYFWIYQPLQDELRTMTHDVEVRFDSVARLQVALTRSTMPVNDYLIHGHEHERRDYQLGNARVEATFVVLRNALADSPADEREKISLLYDRWKKASRQGEALLQLNAIERRSPLAAMAMENFDEVVDHMVDEADLLLDEVRRDLQRSRERLELRRERMTWFVTISVLIAALVTLVTVVYLGQLIPRYLDRTIDGTKLGDFETPHRRDSD